ncbi:MAG: GAF domain-containing protein [Anaeromyxobacter sp.]
MPQEAPPADTSPVHWWSQPGPAEAEAIRQAMAALPIAVVLVEAGPDGPPRVLAWNTAYERLTGAPPPPGAPFSALPYQLFRPDRATPYRTEEIPGVQAALTGLPVNGVETHFQLPDGSWRVGSVSAAPVPPLAGSSRRQAVAVLLDQTQAYEAEAQRQRLARLAALTQDGLFLIRKSDGKILDVNQAATAIYGYTREEFLRLWVHDLRADAPGDDAVVAKLLASISPAGRLLQARHVRRDGTSFPVETTARSELLQGQPVIVASVRDLTDRLALEARARLAHRALVTLLRCNEALVRASTEQELLQAICATVVEAGGQRMCWVGWLEDDARRSIRPVAWAGHVDGYLDGLELSWADVPLGQGPAGRAARSGAPVIIDDWEANPALQPWHERARSRGYHSCMAIPLVSDDRVLGVLALYAGEPHAFIGEVRELMTQLGADLAYGLTALRARAERDHARDRLQRSREELRALAGRLDAVREEEKARIARDLHDDMGQLLTGLRVALDQVEETVTALPPDRVSGELLDRVVDASSLASRAVDAVRQAVARLRPAALDRLGLVPALRQECRDFHARARVDCALEALEDLALGPEVELALFRIAQEALTNVARHAGARQVQLSVALQDGAAVLTVADDGRGLPSPRPAGLGLVGMRERAERLGGELDVQPRPGGGTTVIARIPVAHPEAA